MQQKLPVDILLTIIESGLPPNLPSILPQSHEITKTLLAWTRVCRATYSVASRLLRKHCTYIDSGKRLESLLKTLEREAHATRRHLGSSIGTPTQMFLGPFPDADYNTIPRPLNRPLIAVNVCALLKIVAPTLRRLVIDMPLRSLYPEEDTQNVRKPLRQGFSALVNLEEFVSVRDELYLNVEERGRDEPEVWATCWPKLRLLSLYNVDMSPDTHFLEHLASVPSLESVIFPRPDGLDYWYDMIDWQPPNSAIDIKKAWLDALSANAENGRPRRRRDLTIMFVNVQKKTPIFEAYEEIWEEIDPEGRICVKFCEALATCLEMFGLIRGVQDFVKSHAIDGTLFDAKLGERIDLPSIC